MTRVAVGLSTLEDTGDAARSAALEASPGADVDLALLFLSPEHCDDAEAAADAVREVLAPRLLLGCAAEGVVAGGREFEEGPAAAVWAASLPGAEVSGFHASTVEVGGALAITGLPPIESPDLVALLVDPFTFPAGPFLERLSEEHPGLPVVGGIAVGAREPGEGVLILDDVVHVEGAVGAIVSGANVVTVVSQGCAPIGHDAVVTAAEGNVVHELAGEPALERLRRELESLAPEQQRLAMNGVLAGLVIDENKPEYGRGDFLMRGVLGADEESGALALGERVRVGQTLRFHVRDAASADADLRQALGEAVRRGRPAGALLFTCNGRGTNMFDVPDHDAQLVTSALGVPSVAGFFCGGEIGPVGPRTFLHGFTATLAVFLDR
jgi:small ligand-binding sensory domain FIST